MAVLTSALAPNLFLTRQAEEEQRALPPTAGSDRPIHYQ